MAGLALHASGRRHWLSAVRLDQWHHGTDDWRQESQVCLCDYENALVSNSSQGGCLTWILFVIFGGETQNKDLDSVLEN